MKYYPKGPKPLPFFGNFLMLMTYLNRHPVYLFVELARHYGDIYTFWLGSKPVVIISGIELAKQAFNRNECCDRIEPYINDFICDHLGNNYVMLNMCDQLKILRQVSVKAVRKLISSNVMHEITHKLVDETIDIIRKTERENAFAPFKYIDSILVRATYQITFKEKIDFDDNNVTEILNYFDCIQNNLLKLIIAGYIPLLKSLINTNKVKNISKRYITLLTKCYHKVKNNSSIGCSDTFQSLSETHIIAANEILSEDMNKAKYLNDENIISNLNTLVSAASDTTHHTFHWILLFMSKYQDMQQRMRKEVKENIGNRIPNKEDRETCHFVNAFICETMRYRPVAYSGLPHSTSHDICIANVSIPKGTMLLLNQISILNDNRYWDKPEIFNPQRFLDSEQHFITNIMPAFIPFGTGKRMCIGDRFAMDLIFLVLTRLLQSTEGSTFELEDINTNLEAKKSGLMFEPISFKLSLIE